MTIVPRFPSRERQGWVTSCTVIQNLQRLYLTSSSSKFPALDKEGLGVVGPGAAKQELHGVYLRYGNYRKAPFEGGRDVEIVHEYPLILQILGEGALYKDSDILYL